MSEARQQLNVWIRRVDIRGMVDLELELVRENPSWVVVLQAYHAAQEELAAAQAEAAKESAPAENSSVLNVSPTDDANTDDDFNDEAAEDLGTHQSRRPPARRATRWVQRISKVPNTTTEELSKIHGRLIAYDLLKCDLMGQSAGMVYQLTSTGKQVLIHCEDEDLAAVA